MPVQYVLKNHFPDIQFFLFPMRGLLVFSGLPFMPVFLGKPGHSKKQEKNAENRYSKGFETIGAHTSCEIWRKDKGVGVKNLELKRLYTASSKP